MATKAKARTEHVERGGARSIKHQPNRFAGLFLAPFAGLLTAWLIHVWTLGVNLHAGPLSWVVHASAAAPYVAVALITAATIGVAVMAWRFTEHREAPKRSALAGSVGVVGALFAINVGTGPHYWWSGLFIIGGWVVAITWSIARLDVARNDKSTEEAKEDGFLEKHGLKGWRVRKSAPVVDEHGEQVATEIEFQHAEGDTVEKLQDAVSAFESASASPVGLSRATGSDRADQSKLTVLHRDPLVGVLRLPPPSCPGGSITDPVGIRVGTYSTGAPARMFIAGVFRDGKLEINPQSYLFMGMTRTGKTTAENQVLAEAETRRDVVILYLNKAKGAQDVRPVIPGIEAAVIADEQDTAGLYREALRQVKRMMTYRQRQLALFGISAWHAGCYAAPPWRTDESGRRVQMEPMPALIVHVGEADAILSSAQTESVYLSSKGLSLGIIAGWSLQRADYIQMPTGLRFNLGAAMCFGCGDDDSAGFALTSDVIRAGAHPERWKQTKPGYFYYQGPGVDDEMWPVHARSFGEGPNGEDINEALLSRCLEWAPRMARLDQGSVLATNYEQDGKAGNWWTETAAETDNLRAQLLGGKSATVPATTTPQVRTLADPDAEELAEARAEMEAEMRETTHVGDVQLYPEIDGRRATPADATRPIERAEQEFSWEDDRPAPRDRDAAIKALRQALLELSADAALLDSADPTGNTWIVNATLISERYPFRSRPFFVEALNAMSSGQIAGPAQMVLTYAADLGAGRGKYRIQRVPAGGGA